MRAPIVGTPAQNLAAHCGECEGILSLTLNSPLLERGRRSPGLRFPEEINPLQPFFFSARVIRLAAQPPLLDCF
jgi:hypothetical protein